MGILIGILFISTIVAAIMFGFFSEYANKKSHLIAEERIKSRQKEIDTYFVEEQKKFNCESSLKKKQVEDEIKRFEAFKLATIKILQERQIGFPWIADKIAAATTIIYKNNYQKRNVYKYRESLKEIDILKGILDFYEYLYPHLKEFRKKQEVFDDIEENPAYSDEEKANESSFWLTPEEYRKLPSAERNQLALERWKAKAMSNWEIGKFYENYIGYEYEQKGYRVRYSGIEDKLEDRGLDLICENQEEVVAIQCKNWSSSKTIYEKHIFQFYGSVFYYKINRELKVNPLAPRTVRGIFYTSTILSDFARLSAKEMKIELQEGYLLDKGYPCIKCNVNNGEKIYHLPFDQQYDRTKITPPDEFYAKTCQEAERAGFRRAMRHLH